MRTRKTRMKKGVCALLLALLLCAPVAAASEQARDEAVSAPEETRPPARENRKRLFIILGGTIVGVTGMWVTLYRRGK